MDKKVVELFAGVGGFHLGFKKSDKNWDFAWANQWEPSRKVQYAFDCYKKHFGEETICSNEDIAKVETGDIPKHSVLVGGFPCQDYSVAATGAKGIQGKKGVLWWEIYRILKSKEPPFVLLENVDRLLKSPASQRGRDFGVMLSCLANLGYSVQWRVINAADYGFAQRRRRVFIFAYKNDTYYRESLLKYSPEEIVYDKGFFQQQFQVEANYNNILEYTQLKFGSNQDIEETSDVFSLKFHNTGFMANGRIYTADTKPKYTGVNKILCDIIEAKSIDESYYINDEEEQKFKYMKGSKRIERTSKSGHKYIFSEGDMAFPDPLDRPGRTMLTSEASKNRSTHIIVDPIKNKLRKLTPIECERLNGFEDDWTNTGMTERFRYFCMGNALVVGLVTKMSIELSDIIDKEK